MQDAVSNSSLILSYSLDTYQTFRSAMIKEGRLFWEEIPALNGKKMSTITHGNHFFFADQVRKNTECVTPIFKQDMQEGAGQY